jgi:hypothetical protein
MTIISSFVKRHALVTFFVLAFVLSWIPWLLYMRGMSLGVSLSAVIVAPIAGGWSELKELLGRLVRWRVGARWYVVALVLPTMIVVVTISLTRVLGAVPHLQAARSALVASLILGVITAAWHLPLFVTGIWQQPVPHILFIIVQTIVLTWVFNKSNGSVLLTMLFHGVFNGVTEFLYPLIGLPNLDIFWWTLTGVMSVVALALLLLSGRELGRAPAPTLQVTSLEGVSG